MKMINVTDITSYLYCPRKLYLKKVRGLKEEATKPMILGFLKHKVFENFSKNEEGLITNITEKIGKGEIKEKYRNELKKIISNVSKKYWKTLKGFGIDLKELSESVNQFMDREIELRKQSIGRTLEKGYLGGELWDNLKPKYLTELRIESPELGLKGRVDRVKLGNGITPYEIKTRKKNRVYFSDKIQLAAYSLLLEKEFEKKIGRGVIEMSKSKEIINLDEGLKKKVLEIAEKIRNLEKNKPPKIPSNFNKCKNCRLKKECLELKE